MTDDCHLPKMDYQQLILDTSIDISLEDLCKTDLIDLLKENREHNCSIVTSNNALQELVEKLEKTLVEQSEKCQNLEDDRSFLRTNIKKASTHWFERKKKLSESDNDQNQIDDTEKNLTELKLEQQNLLNEGSANILLTQEALQIFIELKFKNEQLELSEMQRNDLTKRLSDYERVIDDQEIVIHGLEHQLEAYFEENQKMCKQLSDLHRLFREIEAINERQVKTPEPVDNPDTTKDYLPTEDDFKEMKGSVSKTYLKLKELIYEKKSLVTEIERLQTLNIELQNRVSNQENRLINVSDALQTTWLLVSNLKDEHSKIRTSRSILRYELREKREILQKLRLELENSREQWQIIREKNDETEKAWKILRTELNERRLLAESKGDQNLTPEEIEGAVGGTEPVENEFEPPVDLLIDMGIEYGVVDADDEEPVTAIALISGESVQNDRLQNLEVQCCNLYQKLMTSTARAINLASRLTTLHDRYGNNEDEESDHDLDDLDDDDDDEDNVYLEEEEDALQEVETMSHESENFDPQLAVEMDDTVLDSQVTDELPSSSIPVVNNNSGEDVISDEQTSDTTDENCDVLSRTLITFLPRKIEILKRENKKLEDRLVQQHDEKVKIEETFTSTLEFECRQRKELEKQLRQLGKCVDELKLERNGKIEALEQQLHKKMEDVKKEEEDEFIDLKEKFDQREMLLRLTSEQMQIAQEKSAESEENEKKLQEQVQKLSNELDILKMKILEERKISEENSKAMSRIPTITQEPFLNSSSEEGGSSFQANCDIDEEHLIILTKDILRIPFSLEKGSTLLWSLEVHSEKITFSVIFERLKCTSHPDECGTSDQSFQIKPYFPTRSDVSVARTLLEPFVFFRSNGVVKGSLSTKVNGLYIIILKNSTSRSQDVSFKIWKQAEFGHKPVK